MKLGRVYLLFALVVIVVGGAVVVQGWRVRNLARATWEWPAVEGRVEERRVERRYLVDAGYEYVPVVEYSYRVGEREYRGTRLSYGRLSTTAEAVAQELVAAYEEGAPVEVFVDPLDPERAVLLPGDASGLTARAVKGGVLMGIGGVALILYVRHRRGPSLPVDAPGE